MIDISIIISGIRINKWINIINSIKNAITTSTFECIFVGPYNPPTALQKNKYIHYHQDFGSPNRCQQICATLASGKYLMWFADDGIWEKNTLQHAIDILDVKSDHTVVVTKYTEGQRNNPVMMQDSYYQLGNAFPKTPYIPHDWWIFNSAVINKTYFEYLGGFDNVFESTCVPHGDLAVRAQRDGANVIMLDASIAHATHMPNLTGDHAPIHHAMIKDMSLFLSIYSDSDCIKRKCIKLDDWKTSPKIWKGRFITNE